MCRVIKVVQENQDINSLYLEASDEKFSNRKAGQFLSLMMMRPDGWSEPHSFSLSGAPEESYLRLTIKNVGRFTSSISLLKPETEIKCRGPFGTFCKDIDAKPSIVMIAGGVGVAPFLSVLRHFRNIKASNAVTLFWVNRTMEEFFSLDEIAAVTGELPLKVVCCLSRGNDVSQYFRREYPGLLYEKGRLSGDILEKFGINPDAAFYLCGPIPMMDAALTELEKRGVNRTAVQQERYA